MVNEINTCSFKKMHLKMSSAKWRPFCLGLDGLNNIGLLLPSESYMTFTFVSTENRVLFHFNESSYCMSCTGLSYFRTHCVRGSVTFTTHEFYTFRGGRDVNYMFNTKFWTKIRNKMAYDNFYVLYICMQFIYYRNKRLDVCCKIHP